MALWSLHALFQPRQIGPTTTAGCQTIQITAQYAPLSRGNSRFRLRVLPKGRGLKPYGWEIYDDDDGRTVRRSPAGFRTPGQAWQAGLTVLHQQG